MPDPKKLIVVLGAHRSGTSLCVAAIESLGAETCLEDHYANPENQKGFFEHPALVEFNDSLLAAAGGSWDNPLYTWAGVAEPAAWRAKAVALIERVCGGAQVAVIKDPRICQLLPFWLEVFGEAGYQRDQVRCVHVFRDPVEVAISQRKRAQANSGYYEFGRTLAEGAALWLSLSAQAIEHSRGIPCCYVSYASLLGQTGEALAALAGFLGLELSARSEAFAAGFVDQRLYRSAADPASRQLLSAELPQLLEFYQALGLAANDPASAVAALAVYRRADTRQKLVQICTPALSRLSARCRDDGLALARAGDEIDHAQAQLAELGEHVQRVQREHQAVLAPLREELGNLQQGNCSLQEQLSAQAAERLRVEADYSAAVERLTAHAGELEVEAAQLAGERALLDEHLRQMQQSSSWRLTRPLRATSRRLQSLRGWSGRRWVQFRLRAILIYHRMSLRQPKLAWHIRKLLRPLFRHFNRVFGAGPRETHAPLQTDLLKPMRYQQQEASASYRPLVSVIVPNYNHAPYLPLRLESIFSQSYANFEVILLDDASSDDSASVLRRYHERYPDKSTLVINPENSGGVFHQWERGLNLARGEIVWIAESDDWCTENFLETLVPYFENEAIQLAYARTVFMDGEGDEQIWSISEYLHDIDPQRWNGTILETGPAIVREAFAVKNIIPNVSSALFRPPRQLEILRDPQWRQMRTCGDWVLYLHLLRGGMLAYSPLACNYYRIHGANTSVSSYAQDAFYREHELVARTARQFFDVPRATLEILRDNLAIHWRETRGDYSDEALADCFSLERIVAGDTARAPNLLMASYAFCSGGGETFPVSLANIMKASGYNVTYLDCAREPRMDGVRNKLRPDIPVVSDFSQLERIIADFDIDLVHSHHAWMDSTVLDILPEDAACKTIATLHGMYETINEYELKPILPRLVRRSACLIYVAEKNLQAIREHGLIEQARLARIDNALEVEAFERVSRGELGIPEDAFVLTVVSRAMAEKGWAEAIDAVALAREASGRNLHLVLVGDGPEYERLAQTALPAYIHLAGFQRNVRGYFAMADIGFLPSRFRGESFPLVIIECLQSGVPFLASDLGEISRMLTGEAGMAGAVLPLDGDKIDIPALGGLIAAIATDEAAYRAMGEAVPAAAAKFDPEVLAAKHDQVYRAALGA